MSEYIVSVPDEKAKLFIARFGIGGTQIFGHRLVGEIVRCGDCKRSEETPSKWFCHRFSMFDNAGFPVEPNGFCAWGERRES